MAKSFLQKFIFNDIPVCGSFVVLDNVWHDISKQKNYPESIKQFLGEILISNVLLVSNLKLNGKVTIQIQNNPNINLVMSECDNDLNVRATAKFYINNKELKYEDYFAKGNLLINIDSKNDGQIYQSVVDIGGSNVAGLIEEYMQKSEQLKSSFIINYTNEKIIAIMLQQLPDNSKKFIEEINRVFLLIKTLNPNELNANEVDILLKKLFEDEIILFNSNLINFKCSCNNEKVLNIINSIGYQDASEIILEQSNIKITCDFCNKIYSFNKKDIDEIFDKN